ncbi:hypothetical protein [Ramlibacter algicola]|uniref:Uncharacterized protein n=1 Tax=Ramlibacter algicola TaxID=2795217 RepID=A0A934Q1Y8_9BURK|nr:hypothetical protein [Ramlibacter algicola]MBK0392804.1 hypothetical protein [Ramlibacter algicola]
MDQMQQHQPVARTDLLTRTLPVLSIVTMAMTVPQVWAVWVQGQTAGVSILSWGAYFVSACLWLADGLRKGQKTIWVACIGWVLLDGAVVLGVLLH